MNTDTNEIDTKIINLALEFLNLISRKCSGRVLTKSIEFRKEHTSQMFHEPSWQSAGHLLREYLINLEELSRKRHWFPLM